MSRRVLLLAVALMVFGLVLGVVVTDVGRRGSFAGRFSTWSADPDGLRAAYLTLERTGVALTRRTQDLADLSRTDALLLVAPSERIPKYERDALLAWVESGHTLIFAPDRASPLVDELGLEFTRLAGGLAPRPISEEQEDEALGVGGRRKRPKAAPAKGKDTASSSQPAPGPPAPASQPAAASQPCAPASQPCPAAGDQIAAADQAPPEELAPAQPAVATSGVTAARAIPAGALRAAKAGVTLVPLLCDERGRDVAVLLRRGKGQVLVLAAPDLLTNRRLGAADNARLAHRLAATALDAAPRHAHRDADAPPRLEIDEFHHGFQGSRTVTGYLWRGNLRWVVLQLLFLGALGLLRVWRRFGPIMAPPEASQTARDYLMAMARIYRLGGHRAAAAERVWRYARRQVATRLGLTARGQEAAPAEMARIGLGELARLYARAEHARTALDRPNASDGDLAAFGRAAFALEAEARRGRQKSRGRPPERRTTTPATAPAAPVAREPR